MTKLVTLIITSLIGIVSISENGLYGGNVSESSYEASVSSLEDADVGEIIEFGNYYLFSEDDGKRPIQWIVINQEDSRLVLMSRFIIDNSKYEDIDDMLSILNNECFNDEEKELITETQKGTVFLPSMDELNKIPSDLLYAYATPYAENPDNILSKDVFFDNGYYPKYSPFIIGVSSYMVRDFYSLDEHYSIFPAGVPVTNDYIDGIRPCICISRNDFQDN